jgi:hypothetical protein
MTPKATEKRANMFNAVDQAARDVLSAGKSRAPASGASAKILPVLATTAANPLGSLASRASVMTQGFDMDFTDMCDLPSYIDKAYYRSRSTRPAARGSSGR